MKTKAINRTVLKISKTIWIKIKPIKIIMKHKRKIKKWLLYLFVHKNS